MANLSKSKQFTIFSQVTKIGVIFKFDKIVIAFQFNKFGDICEQENFGNISKLYKILKFYEIAKLTFNNLSQICKNSQLNLTNLSIILNLTRLKIFLNCSSKFTSLTKFIIFFYFNIFVGLQALVIPGT